MAKTIFSSFQEASQYSRSLALTKNTPTTVRRDGYNWLVDIRDEEVKPIEESSTSKVKHTQEVEFDFDFNAYIRTKYKYKFETAWENRDRFNVCIHGVLGVIVIDTSLKRDDKVSLYIVNEDRIAVFKIDKLEQDIISSIVSEVVALFETCV